MITIYTRTNSPLKKEFWKWVFKKIIRKKTGPDAVFKSLISGLQELNIKFEVNPLKAKYKIIHVLSGVEALKSMLNAKVKKQDFVLIAGPIISVTPEDSNAILTNEEIDIILFPSKWPKDFFCSIKPSLENKIKIWPSGVFCINNPMEKQNKNTILIFIKNIPEKLLQDILQTLDKRGEKYKLLSYGDFNQKEYFEELNKSKFMIYLSPSESQGLALHEAWARNVPTLVWDNQMWQYKEYSWSSEKISCPYLTDECGLTFKDSLDFEEKLNIFLNKLDTFTPRQYNEQNFTNKKTTEIYLEIINNYKK